MEKCYAVVFMNYYPLRWILSGKREKGYRHISEN